MEIMQYYTGIGSRKIETSVIPKIRKVAIAMHEKGYRLRSGGADGSDKEFETNSPSPKNENQIFLPWKNFNNNPSPFYNISKEAEILAKKYHPLGQGLSGGVLKLMARNCYQVLGEDLKTPTKYVFCYTPNPAYGGTSQALRIAKDYGIPIYNLYDMTEDDVEKVLNTIPNAT